MFTDATTLYASSYDLWRVAVEETGLAFVSSHRDLALGGGYELAALGGKLFASSGQVIDPTGPTELGRFPRSGHMAVADDGSRVYFIRKASSSYSGYYAVYCMDPLTFAETGSIEFQTLAGDMPGGSVDDFPADIELWGSSGLALQISSGGVVLLPDILAGVPGC